MTDVQLKALMWLYHRGGTGRWSYSFSSKGRLVLACGEYSRRTAESTWRSLVDLKMLSESPGGDQLSLTAAGKYRATHRPIRVLRVASRALRSNLSRAREKQHG